MEENRRLWVVRSSAHLQHQPPREIFEGGVVSEYLESVSRIHQITQALEQTTWAELINPEPHDTLSEILSVHDHGYIEYLRTAFSRMCEEKYGQIDLHDVSLLLPPMILAATFPTRRTRHIPKSLAGQCGYYSFDTNCPIVEGTWLSAVESVNLSLTAVDYLLRNNNNDDDNKHAKCVFSLNRPPGHHAGFDFAGGYCYLNSAVIAARYLSGRVSDGVGVLDIDYHAGNGTQDLVNYHHQYGVTSSSSSSSSAPMTKVYSVSIHRDPNDQYPYFAGFAEESTDCHLNIPLAGGITDSDYLIQLNSALDFLLVRHSVKYIVVSFGLDTFEKDPLGDFKVTINGFSLFGQRLANLIVNGDLKGIVVALEGGYAVDELGLNVVSFLSSFVKLMT